MDKPKFWVFLSVENDSNINAFSHLINSVDETYGFVHGFGDLKSRLLLLEVHWLKPPLPPRKQHIDNIIAVCL